MKSNSTFFFNLLSNVYTVPPHTLTGSVYRLLLKLSACVSVMTRVSDLSASVPNRAAGGLESGSGQVQALSS